MAKKKVAKKNARGGRPKGRLLVRHQAVAYHPKNDPKHYKDAFHRAKTLFPTGFGFITGLAPALLRRGHLETMGKMVEGEYPTLRKSAARLFMEGYLTDGEPPLRQLPVGSIRHLETALLFLDVLETMVYVDGLDRLASMDRICHPKTPYRPLRADVLPEEGDKERAVLEDDEQVEAEVTNQCSIRHGAADEEEGESNDAGELGENDEGEDEEESEDASMNEGELDSLLGLGDDGGGEPVEGGSPEEEE